MMLAKWLQSKKVTMAEFAELLGVSHSTVWRWCNGEVFPPGEKLIAIRAATKGAVNANDFMPDDEEVAD